MQERTYRIVMRTLIGEKRGSMSVKVQQDKMVGTISLLGHTEPFRGLIDGAGRFVITGKLVSLMYSLKYFAEGAVKGEEIHFLMHADGREFEVNGSLCDGKEFDA